MTQEREYAENVSLSLYPRHIEALDRIVAARRDTNRSRVVREALDAYLRRIERGDG